MVRLRLRFLSDNQFDVVDLVFLLQLHYSKTTIGVFPKFMLAN